MAKEDFCFTFYDGDATRDASHMNRLERGAYYDLIIAQRKFGRLSIEQIRKILGKDFTEVWPALELSLVCADGFYFVEWVEKSLEQSRKHSRHQSENGKKGGRPGKNKPEQKPLESQLKPNTNPTESQKKPLEDGYGDEDVLGSVFESEDLGKSENPLREDLIIPQMAEVWKTTFPTYTFNRERDYKALGEILSFMAAGTGNHDPTNADVQCRVLNTLQLIADEVKKETFWVNKPLKSIASNIQEFYNKIKNPVNGKAGKKYDDNALKEKLLKRYGNRG